MVDGVKGFAQVNEHCTSQLTLINVPPDGGPLCGVALAKTALIRTKNFVALKISVH